MITRIRPVSQTPMTSVRNLISSVRESRIKAKSDVSNLFIRLPFIRGARFHGCFLICHCRVVAIAADTRRRPLPISWSTIPGKTETIRNLWPLVPIRYSPRIMASSVTMRMPTATLNLLGSKEVVARSIRLRRTVPCAARFLRSSSSWTTFFTQEDTPVQLNAAGDSIKVTWTLPPDHD